MKKLVLFVFLVNFSFGFYCYKPTMPYCVEFGNFNSKSDFEMCKMEVENYLRDLQEYIHCLEDEISEAIEEQNEVIKKFNYKTRGDIYCY